MKPTTRLMRVGVAALFLGAAAFLIAADTLPRPSDLTVHEWGTFTSVAGEDGSAIEWNALEGKDDLPGFVNRQALCFKSSLWGTVRMETPVMYFYSPHEVTASVNVKFPHGVITEWYPKAEHAIYQSKSPIDPAPAGLGPQLVKLSPSLNGIDLSLRSVMGAISWNVKVEPGAALDFPEEKAPSRYYAARGTDATPITAGGQHEKFLFYRGVARIPVPLSARLLADGRLVVENRGPDMVPAAILFENRGGRLGYRNAGAVLNGITLDAPSLDGSLAQLRQDLETALVAQGLFPKEAHAMVETWRDSWFEEGSRLIYIVPSSAVDAMLPLKVDPVPSRTARVFVGRIELVTAETKRVVEEALAAGNWPVIARYGRFLEPILERISGESPSAATRVEQFRRNIPASIVGGGCR